MELYSSNTCYITNSMYINIIAYSVVYILQCTLYSVQCTYSSEYTQCYTLQTVVCSHKYRDRFNGVYENIYRKAGCVC